MPKKILVSIPLALTLAFAGEAFAAGFQLWEQNASGLGVAYAGSAAVADNASTIFFNPAGMTQQTGLRFSAGVAGVDANFRFNGTSTAGTGGMGGDAGGGWQAIPNAYVSWQVSPQVFVGLGVSSPFGLSTEYKDGATWMGRFHAQKSSLTTINVNPSLAYRLNNKVSLGAGINYQQIDAEMSNLVAPGGTAYRLKGDDSSWGWNVGALFTLSPAMRVGVSYRSAIEHKLEGTRTLGAASVPANAKLKLPDTFILSVWQQVSDRWEAMGDLSYTRWSSIDTLRIFHSGVGASPDVENFNYQNSWRFAWGAAYKVNEAWKTKFGIAYDRTPTTDGDRSARVPDNNRLWLTLGGQWRPSLSATVDFGYAYLYLRDTPINQTKGTQVLNGRYESSAHVLGVQYSQGF